MNAPTQTPDNTFVLAAGIMIDPSGKLLVVRKANTQKFMLPGGKIDANETPLETLLREIKEEIGITLSPALPQFIQKYRAPAANEPGFFIESNLFMLLLPQHMETTPKSEIAEARWITPKEAESLDLAPLMRSFVVPLWLDLIQDIGKDLGFHNPFDA